MASGRCAAALAHSPFAADAGLPSTAPSRAAPASGSRDRPTTGGALPTRSMPTFARTASISGATASSSIMAATSSMPRCCSCRRSGSCRPAIRGSSAPSRRSKRSSWSRVRPALFDEQVDDGVGGRKAPSWPARSGSPMPIACSSAMTRPRRCSAAARHPQRSRPDRGVRPAGEAAPRQFSAGFSHVGLINTAYNLIKAHGPARQHSDGRRAS